MELRRYEDAAPLFSEAVARSPDDARLRCGLAVCLYHLGRLEEASREVDAARRLDPSDEWPWRVRGLILMAQGKNRDAVAACLRAVELAPTSPEAHVVHSRALLADDRPVDARAAALHAMALAPDEPGPHESYGLAMLRLKDPRQAEQAFRHAISLAPTRANLFNNLGVALERQGREAEATEHFARAAALDPEKPLYRRNVGVSADRLTKVSVPFVALAAAAFLFGGAGGVLGVLMIAGVVSAWQRRRLRKGLLTGAGGDPLPPGVVDALHDYRKSQRVASPLLAIMTVFVGLMLMISSMGITKPEATATRDAVLVVGCAFIAGGILMIRSATRRRRKQPSK